MGGGRAVDRHIDLDEQIVLLAHGRLGGGLHREAELLGILGDLDRRDRDGVGHAHQPGHGLAFERTQDLEVRGEDRLPSLLDGGERHGVGGHEGRRGADLGERGGVVDATAAGIGLAHDDEVPVRGGHAGARAEFEGATIRTLGDGLLTERGDAGRRPYHEHADGALEPFLALGDHGQGKHAVLDDGHLGHLDLQRVGGGLDDRDGQAILDALIIDDVAVADDVVDLAHPSDDGLLGVEGQHPQGHDGLTERGVGRGLEDHRHVGQVLGGGVGEEAHARREAGGLKAVVATDARAGEVLQQRHAPAARHRDELAVVAIVNGIIRRGEREAGQGRGQLDAVDEVGAAALEVVAHAQRVDAVGRDGDAEAGI